MSSRRKFLGQVASGLGTLAIPGAVSGSSGRIRVGIIGYGTRGSDLAAEAHACEHSEIVAICDIYSANRDRALQRFPDCEIFEDYRAMLEDNSFDAVVIATPPHRHSEPFIDALSAGKHVYQESTMAFHVSDAKRMRAAWVQARSRQVVQIGHQSCSSGQATDAAAFLRNGNLGRITAVNAAMYRNSPPGKPHWSRPIYPDMTPENISWLRFLGEPPESGSSSPFDANRFVNWRLFWDYSGGNVYESMSQQVAFWSKTLRLEIPEAVTMTGGVYLWKDGREVPDTMNVSMEQPEELLFTWSSGAGNGSPGVTEHVMGTDGSIFRNATQIRYLPEKVNRREAEPIVGRTQTLPRAHMENFLDCIRNSKEPNCPFEIGYKVSIACRMAIESYFQRRTVYWNSEKEEIV